MFKKTLVFVDSIDGHNLEYINHLYTGALLKDNDYVFILPISFLEVSNKFIWPNCSNIVIELFEDSLISKYNNKILKALKICRLIQKKVSIHNCNSVFLISLMNAMPFLPFLLKGSVKISGIIYKVFLYRWKHSSIIVRFADVLKYILFSNFNNFYRIYLLNDSLAPVFLNKKYKTSVFSYLVDPIVPLSVNGLQDFRKDLNISPEKIVFLHFGALTSRKGTIEILEAICLIDDYTLSKCSFIFAGVVFNDIKDIFYELVNIINKKTKIIIFDRFCDYEFLGSLCVASNYVLIPYKNFEQSSGVLGYAAQFNIPVVGPSSGLLGKLIKKNKLGFTINDITSSSLANFINNSKNNKNFIPNNYLDNRTVSTFIGTIFMGVNSRYEI